MIAVPREHRLANKSILEIEDLYGETLIMVKRGDSGINDFLRNDLEKHHPKIPIEDTPHFYDLSIFNRCAETGNYSIPYGLLYSLQPPEDVLRFVKTVENTIHISL